MTQVLGAVKDSWLEKTDYPIANIAIGCTKLLAGAALTGLAIRNFPKMGLAGGLLVSSHCLVEALAKWDDKCIYEFETDLDEELIEGKLAIRSFKRGIELVTFAALLKIVGTTLYYRDMSLLLGSAQVVGGLAGVALVGTYPLGEWLFLENKMNHDDDNFRLGQFGYWLGVWHPL